MTTYLLSDTSLDDIYFAGSLLKAGEVVAIPTETVYGLAAVLKTEAVEKIFKAKGRPADNPLIVHVSNEEEAELYAHVNSRVAKALMNRFWPGPLTLVLPKKNTVPDIVTAGLDTVAIRCPSHQRAREIIRAAGGALAAPSANRSGSISPTTAGHVYDDMNGHIAGIVNGGMCKVGVESTVIDLTGARPRLLRPGFVTAEDLRILLGQIEIDEAVTKPVGADEAVRAPGMKYKHYAPKTPLTILAGPPEYAASFLWAQPGKNVVICFELELLFFEVPSAEEGIIVEKPVGELIVLNYGKENEPETLMRNLYSYLHKADMLKPDHIYARIPETKGGGAAVANRLLKAAGFEVIDPLDYICENIGYGEDIISL